jgi:hypothetical protein
LCKNQPEIGNSYYNNQAIKRKNIFCITTFNEIMSILHTIGISNGTVSIKEDEGDRVNFTEI